MAFTENLHVLSAVTTAGANSSLIFDVSMRSRIGFVFTCASHTSGNGVFTIDGSIDGTNFVTGLALQDATSTAATTFVTSKTLSSNTSGSVYLPVNAFRYIRVNVSITTDGTYDAWMQTAE